MQTRPSIQRERASARLINEIARDLHGFRVVVVISGVRAKLAT